MHKLREAVPLAAFVLAAGIAAGLIGMSSVTAAHAGDVTSVRHVCFGVLSVNEYDVACN